MWKFTDESGRVVSRVSGDMWESILFSSLTEDEKAMVPAFSPDIPKLVEQAIEQIRIERYPIMNILDGLQSTANTKGDQATALLIETEKEALRDLTKIDLSACETLAEMKVAVLTRYAQIASDSPALKSAFTEAIR